mmetsp:Transcript_6484/g.8500  ORF Transcript_6484/g.8500 Transcript_6484/m.8500 type:complete len:85 (-) Transcript_6484:196-450(-)
MPKTPNLQSDDYYEILGCERNADEAQLKKAYRKLAVKVSECTHTRQEREECLFLKMNENWSYHLNVRPTREHFSKSDLWMISSF